MAMMKRTALVCAALVAFGAACEPEDGVPDGGVAAPDLYVKSLTLNPATPTDGTPVSVTVIIGNKGSAPVTAPSQVGWYAGEGYPAPSCEWTIGSATTPIAAGAEVTVTCTYAGYPSWYASINTKVVVDATNKIDEGTAEAEANNTFLKAISVTQHVPTGPDLIVSSVMLDPATPQQGKPVKVTVVVGNRGTSDVPAGADIVRWYATEAAPAPACEWTIGQSGTLSPGATTTVQCTYAGYVSWYASINAKTIVDATARVSETDETNNSLLTHLSVSQ